MEKYLYVVSYRYSISGLGDLRGVLDIYLESPWGPGTSSRVIRKIEDSELFTDVIITSLFYAGKFTHE